MADKAPACTSCGRDLKPHCAQLNVTTHAAGQVTSEPATRCAWWRCTNHVCGVDLHDFTRGVRRLTTGALERITPA